MLRLACLLGHLGAGVPVLVQCAVMAAVTCMRVCRTGTLPLPWHTWRGALPEAPSGLAWMFLAIPDWVLEGGRWPLLLRVQKQSPTQGAACRAAF